MALTSAQISAIKAKSAGKYKESAKWSTPTNMLPMRMSAKRHLGVPGFRLNASVGKKLKAPRISAPKITIP